MGDIRKRIADDRRNARMVAAVASLMSVTLVAFGLLGTYSNVAAIVAYPSLAGLRSNAYVFALATVLSLVLVRWSYTSARNAAMRQRVRAMWLRRSQRETGYAFRTSRVIDQLSRHGISTVTLQDRDVRISFAQRWNRATSIVWRVLTPLTFLLVVVGGFVVYIFLQRDLEDLASSLGALFLLLAFIALASGLPVAGAVVAMGIAVIAGPLQAFLRRSGDDYRRLPRLVERIRGGRRTRSTEILRVSDAHWRDAVTTALSVVDVVIVDISSWSESLAWELDEVSRVSSPRSAVFICRGGLDVLPPEAAAIVANRTGGVVSSHVVWYPTTRYDREAANRFAVALRERIYSAMDAL